MNNALVLNENTLKSEEKDNSPLLIKRAEELGDIIEALQNIINSNSWKVLQKYEFEGDLSSLRENLEDEKDPVKMYRLQGEIKRAKKYSLDKLLVEKRAELQRIKVNLNGK